MKLVNWMPASLCMLLGHTVFAATCSISATPVAFGGYSPFSDAPLDSSGTITVNCSPGNTTYKVSLESGLQGSINNRRMRGDSNSDKLKYDLYTDASRTIIWGNGSGNSQNVTKNSNQTLIVYGRIPAGQNGSVGSYSDAVTVIIEF